MGLVHTRAGPGGAITRSGGKVVVLCYPLFVLPASAFLLDLAIPLLGCEALVCWICVSAARVDVFVIVAPDPSCEQLKNFWDLSVTLRNLSLTFTKFDTAPSFFQCQIQRAECHIDFVYESGKTRLSVSV